LEFYQTNLMKSRLNLVRLVALGHIAVPLIARAAAVADLRRVLRVCRRISAFAALAGALSAQAGFGDRIAVSGTEFRAGADRIWINGANTPWHAWNDFGGGFDPIWWDKHFQQLHDSGINATRVWISCNGEVGINISTNGHVSGCTARFWGDLDNFFQIAKARQVYVMATLISFDHFSTGHAHYQSWRNMILDATNLDSLVANYVVPFVNRYKSNPWLWSIDLCNEPDWIHENARCGALPWQPLQTYFGRAAAAIHTHSEILVTVGICMGPKYLSDIHGTNMLNERILRAMSGGDARAHLDFYSPHYYDWMSRINPSNPFYTSPAGYGLPGNRPVIFGEFPARGTADHRPEADYESACQNGWQGAMGWTSNGVDDNGDLTLLGVATRTFRDRHLRLVYPEAKLSIAVPVKP
jgi:hypothetical protein